MSKQNHEYILKRIEEKKRGIGPLQPFNGNFPYPSSNGEMKYIDKSAIKHIEHVANKTKKEKLSWNDIIGINRSIDPGFSGEFRRKNVCVKTKDGNKRVLTWREMFNSRDKFIKWINFPQGNTIEIAAVAHVKLVILHPFDDGNGRTANLLMDLILLQGGYPVTSIDNSDRYLELLSKINTSEKRLKVLELDFCDKSLSNFCSFMYEMVEKSLDLCLKNI